MVDNDGKDESKRANTPLQSPPQQQQTSTTATKQQHEKHEWCLVVPKRLTQVAYEILVQAGNCMTRPWHLEGRFGSRTHKHDNERMGIPVLSRDHVLAAAAPVAIVGTSSSTKHHPNDEDASRRRRRLRDLLETADVELVYKKYTVSHRAGREPPIHDARIHPEREMTITTSTKKKTTTAISKESSAFTYAELFAGIGGFGVALEALGGACVFASEIDEACRDVFAANFPAVEKQQLLHGDIYQVADQDLPLELDLLVGGFPCQPFSAMGKQPGFECPKGHLFLEIVRVLNVSKPKAFLLENVPGMLQMVNTLQTIVASLEKAGYSVLVEICDARGLTATSRKRLFFVGLRHDLVDSKNPVEIPYIPDLGLRAGDVIDYGPLPSEEESLLRVTDEQLHRMDTEKYWRPAHLAWPNVTCNTIVSHYGKAVSRGKSQLVPTSAYNSVTAISANPRRFSPRECARIMGFPSHRFVIPEKKRQEQGDMARIKELYGMFGNAVCPPLISAIAGALLQHCPSIRGYDAHGDWVAWGRETAVRLAYEATLTKSKNSHRNDGEI